MAQFKGDALDEVCMAMKGHTNWGYLDMMNIKEMHKAMKEGTVVVFWNKDEEEE